MYVLMYVIYVSFLWKKVDFDLFSYVIRIGKGVVDEHGGEQSHNNLFKATHHQGGSISERAFGRVITNELTN